MSLDQSRVYFVRPLVVAAALCLSAGLALGQTATVHVVGYTNPWLAGMPDGTTVDGDFAPTESPATVPFAVTPGAAITFASVTGMTGYDSSVSCSPDGCPLILGHNPENGISGISWCTVSCLVGVFLQGPNPNLTAAPADSDFSTPALCGQLYYTPLLKQVFVIGDGHTDSGELQQFVVPEGATVLYLGTADGTGWFNNVGEFVATLSQGPATPPPACGSADFNCDGDLGTDADIEAFFACLSGACPGAPCTSSADFNGDGDLGTDADIEAFFRVLSGGTC